MAGHAQLKFVMTECSKTQIRLAGLNYGFLFHCVDKFKSLYIRHTVKPVLVTGGVVCSRCLV